jgi:hypothetical protein
MPVAEKSDLITIQGKLAPEIIHNYKIISCSLVLIKSEVHVIGLIQITRKVFVHLFSPPPGIGGGEIRTGKYKDAKLRTISGLSQSPCT